MKRFHVHVAVENLAASVDFYNRLFGQAPAKQRPDYAKWMLDDPRLNFAISARGHAAGVNHFGMQAESAAELGELEVRADAASNGSTFDQGSAACCYARSEKHWIIDPQGLAWEHYLTMADAATFGSDRAAAPDGACCIPLRAGAAGVATEQAACCVPGDATQGEPKCCA